jgi:uncharacterized protein YqcC (DUF446 family)
VDAKLGNKHKALQVLLIQLQNQLKAAQLWTNVPPSPEALNSLSPFCVDTLPFEQWLQFVMLVRFGHMVATTGVLPTQCDIAPMAQDAFKLPSQLSMVATISAIDELISAS